MKGELVVATKNKKKLAEIKELLKSLNLRVTSLADYPGAPRIIENGKTFRENSVKKAVKIAAYTRKLTLGEDSGLCVDALSGRPGVYSSRFSGKDKSDLKNNLKVLRLLGDLPVKKRRAHYFCAAALADEKGLVGVAEGKCTGFIGFELKGESGFGYDPLFVIPGYGKTFAQLGEKVKHKLSHRFRALARAKGIISGYFFKRKR